MNTKENIIDYFQNDFKENPESYPFIAQFWNVEAMEKENKTYKGINYGHFNTSAIQPLPIYKPISKIIDFSTLDE